LCRRNEGKPRYFFYYYHLVCEAIGTAATPGLLCQPARVIMKMIVEKQMECRLAWGNRSSRRKPAPAPLLSKTKVTQRSVRTRCSSHVILERQQIEGSVLGDTIFKAC
jgi:hypothetical protein